MSIERELIKDMKILLECTYAGGLQRNADKLISRAIELLAQPEPEQEPFAWCIESKSSADWCFAADRSGVIGNSKFLDEECDRSDPFPLYKSLPTREPLSEVTKATYFPRQLTEKEINEFCGYKDMTLFCVTAYRWGDREKHSYVVGVFDDLERAIHHAKAEREWRGGKYECEVVSMPLNASKQDRQHEVLYRIPENENL